MNESVDSISNNLKSVEDRREFLLKKNRELLILCSKSIVDIHQNNLRECDKKLKQAKSLLGNLQENAADDLHKIIAIGEQEYVEAVVLRSISNDVDIPQIEELHVDDISYLHGLLDCVGEIKRMIYDLVRNNQFNQAVKLFEIMQDIYNMLYPLAIYDNIVPGIRKKLDVSRFLIESVRELITEETRRSTLISKLDAIEKNN